MKVRFKWEKRWFLKPWRLFSKAADHETIGTTSVTTASTTVTPNFETKIYRNSVFRIGPLVVCWGRFRKEV